MKHRIALILAGCLIVGPAPALQAQSAPPEPKRQVTIEMTDAQIEQCRQGSGCDLYHIDTLGAFVKAQMMAAYKAGQAAGLAKACAPGA